MSTNTAINGFRIPELSDSPANIVTAVGNLGNDVDSRAVPRFATSTARDAAIVSPVAGQLAYVESSASTAQQLQIYNGSAFEVLPRQKFVYKTADESVTSSTTLQNDDHLVLALEANAIYRIEVGLFISGATAADFISGFTYPSGALSKFGQIQPGSISAFNGEGIWAGEPDPQASPSSSFIAGIIATPTFGMLNGLIIMGSTAGNLQFKWAQNVSNGSPVTLESYSWMRSTQVA